MSTPLHKTLSYYAVVKSFYTSEYEGSRIEFRTRTGYEFLEWN
jgi:hypothetical protein